MKTQHLIPILFLATFCTVSAQTKVVFTKAISPDLIAELNSETSQDELTNKDQVENSLRIRPDAHIIKPDYVKDYRLLLLGENYGSHEIWFQRIPHYNELAGPPDFVFFDAFMSKSNLFLSYKILDKTYVEQLDNAKAISLSEAKNELSTATTTNQASSSWNGRKGQVLVFTDRPTISSTLEVSTAKFIEPSNYLAQLKIDFTSGRSIVFTMGSEGVWLEATADYSPRSGIIVNSTAGIDVEIFTQPNQVAGQTNATIRGGVFPKDTDIWINSVKAAVSSNGLWVAKDVCVSKTNKVIFNIKASKG